MLVSRACVLTSLTLSWGHVRALNRLLFDAHEIEGRSRVGAPLCVRIPRHDRRAAHVRDILKLAEGSPVRVGLVGGAAVDDARVVSCPLDGPLVVALPEGTDVYKLPPKPRVDLLLCLPRPLQLERMLPVVAQLGVGTLVLAHAAKVERSYWGSHLLRQDKGDVHTRNALVEGLVQSGETWLPHVVKARDLRRFCDHHLDALFPRDQVARVVAHPHRAGTPPAPRLRDVCPPTAAPRGTERILVAVGPEGGWEEPEELDLLAGHDFERVALGQRVLRSDVAVVAVLALAHDVVRDWDARPAR